MDRRAFLFSLGAIGLGQGLMGCRRNPSLLQVSLLARSLPPQLVSKFRAKVNADTDLKLILASSAEQLFTELQQGLASQTSDSARQPNLLESIKNGIFGSAPVSIYAINSLGDYWLETAIAQNLLQPWPVDQLQGWNTLAPQWQRIVRRDRQGQISATGEIWGAPYRWGATVIAYRKDKFQDLGWTPTDWADLWRPELKNKISLLDQPREIIGLTLKKLGHSYNTQNLETVAQLASELKALDQQVKFYSSSQYLQPLILEDTWIAVGWSTDILSALEDQADLGFIIPQSGTALWSDIWVWPKTATGEGKLIQQWAEFWWQPDIARALSRFTDAVSPVERSVAPNALPSISTAPFLGHQDWFNKSEPLEPISEATRQQYLTLWQHMRRTT